MAYVLCSEYYCGFCYCFYDYDACELCFFNEEANSKVPSLCSEPARVFKVQAAKDYLEDRVKKVPCTPFPKAKGSFLYNTWCDFVFDKFYCAVQYLLPCICYGDVSVCTCKPFRGKIKR